MRILLRFLRLTEMGHELGKLPTLGIGNYTAVTSYFFNALFFIFGGNVASFTRSAVKIPFLCCLRVWANCPTSALALSLPLQAVFLMLRVPMSWKCVCSCGVEAFVGSGLLHMVGLVAEGGSGPGLHRTCRDFMHSIYCGFIGFRFCL